MCPVEMSILVKAGSSLLKTQISEGFAKNLGNILPGRGAAARAVWAVVTVALLGQIDHSLRSANFSFLRLGRHSCSAQILSQTKAVNFRWQIQLNGTALPGNPCWSALDCASYPFWPLIWRFFRTASPMRPLWHPPSARCSPSQQALPVAAPSPRSCPHGIFLVVYPKCVQIQSSVLAKY